MLEVVLFHNLKETSKIPDKVMDRICSVEPIETMKRAYDIELPELDDEYLLGVGILVKSSIGTCF